MYNVYCPLLFHSGTLCSFISPNFRTSDINCYWPLQGWVLHSLLFIHPMEQCLMQFMFSTTERFNSVSECWYKQMYHLCLWRVVTKINCLDNIASSNAVGKDIPIREYIDKLHKIQQRKILKLDDEDARSPARRLYQVRKTTLSIKRSRVTPSPSETSFEKLPEALLSTPHQNISIPHFKTDNWCMFAKDWYQVIFSILPTSF